jgi:hypothetical protein
MLLLCIVLRDIFIHLFRVSVFFFVIEPAIPKSERLHFEPTCSVFGVRLYNICRKL